jgi:SAM-dependent methyltransferase
MLICPHCSDAKFNLNANCSKCGFLLEKIDGFLAFSPELAYASSGFKASYFSELACLEDDNFWFRSRNQLILWALKMYCKNFSSFLEIGCGTGYVLSGISKHFRRATLNGTEIFTAGLSFAANRLPSVNLMQMDARKIPYENEFDVIGAFDVLEHIEQDELVLQQVYSALKPQGLMLLTVPQHPWLWSSSDEYACHVRRYAALDLHQKIESAGFQIVRSTSFVTTLLPAMIISRFFQKKVSNIKFDPAAELQIPSLINNFFMLLLHFELLIINIGINLPFGGSRLVIARKTS